MAKELLRYMLLWFTLCCSVCSYSNLHTRLLMMTHEGSLLRRGRARKLSAFGESTCFSPTRSFGDERATIECGRGSSFKMRCKVQLMDGAVVRGLDLLFVADPMRLRGFRRASLIQRGAVGAASAHALQALLAKYARFAEDVDYLLLRACKRKRSRAQSQIEAVAVACKGTR